MKNFKVREFFPVALAVLAAVIPLTAAAAGPDRPAESLSQSVQFQTISFQDPAQVDQSLFLAFHEFLAKRYPLVHQRLKKEVVNGLSLLYTWEGSDPQARPVILCAHIDVVPIAPGTMEDWTFPPFAGQIADGFIWGRGTMDDKGSLIAILEAVENLLAQGFEPRRTIYLAFGQDEEVGGAEGAVKMAELLAARGVRAEYVLDEGGFVIDGKMLGISKPLAAVGIAEKGYLSVELKVKTEGGHSSMPPAHTAIGILAGAIVRLENRPFPARLEGVPEKTFVALKPELPGYMRFAIGNRWLLSGVIKKMLSRMEATNAMIRTTTAATIIGAGTKENVLPQEARAVVNFRLLPGDRVDQVVERVKQVIDDSRVSVEALGTPRETSVITDTNSEGFKIVRRTIGDLFPEAVVTPLLVLGGTDSRFYDQASDCILRFMPMRVSEEDQQRAHGTNERVSVDNFQEMVEFYAKVIRNSE
jgi:carboxypeptidase PM20D1